MRIVTPHVVSGVTSRARDVSFPTPLPELVMLDISHTDRETVLSILDHDVNAGDRLLTNVNAPPLPSPPPAFEEDGGVVEYRDHPDKLEMSLAALFRTALQIRTHRSTTSSFLFYTGANTSIVICKHIHRDSFIRRAYSSRHCTKKSHTHTK
jgi:hypothetical protein